MDCECQRGGPKKTLDEENLVIGIGDFEPIQTTKALVEFGILKERL